MRRLYLDGAAQDALKAAEAEKKRKATDVDAVRGRTQQRTDRRADERRDRRERRDRDELPNSASEEESESEGESGSDGNDSLGSLGGRPAVRRHRKKARRDRGPGSVSSGGSVGSLVPPSEAHWKELRSATPRNGSGIDAARVLFREQQLASCATQQAGWEQTCPPLSRQKRRS